MKDLKVLVSIDEKEKSFGEILDENGYKSHELGHIIFALERDGFVSYRGSRGEDLYRVTGKGRRTVNKLRKDGVAEYLSGKPI